MQTIKEYLDSLPDMKTTDGKSLRDAMAESMPIWSNQICRGYVVDAMDRANIDKEIQIKILNSLCSSFNLLPYEEAEYKGKR